MDGVSLVDGDSLARRNGRMAFLDREAAEVYLLLDFLSGQADRSLRPTQEERVRSILDLQDRPDAGKADQDTECAEIEQDLCDPTRLVLRTMRIKYPDASAEQTFAADAAFLVRARDALNTRASPATGLTIAFTAMAAAGCSKRRQGDADGVSQFAERAYPQFRQAARGLARWVTVMLYVLPIVLVAALGVSAYAAWGKVMLDTLDAVRRDDGATQQALTAAASGRTASDTKAVCDAPPAERPPVCGRADEIKTRYAVAAFQLAAWERPIRRELVTMEQVSDTSGQKQTEQWATATMTVLGNYIMPILYGLLGSIAYVLRRYYDRLTANLLAPRDLRSNSIRLTLGMVIGGSIGLVYSSSSAAQTTGILGAAATLSTSAIAFLAGYGVEAVFKALDSVITQVFHVNGTSKPMQAKV
jgi:hypothetical protein